MHRWETHHVGRLETHTELLKRYDMIDIKLRSWASSLVVVIGGSLLVEGTILMGIVVIACVVFGMEFSIHELINKSSNLIINYFLIGMLLLLGSTV